MVWVCECKNRLKLLITFTLYVHNTFKGTLYICLAGRNCSTSKYTLWEYIIDYNILKRNMMYELNNFCFSITVLD